MAEAITCPVCRARVETGPLCRRCKADLSLLFDLERTRRMKLNEALTALKHQDLLGADALLAEIDWMRSDQESRRALAVLSLLSGDIAMAVQRHQQV